LYYKYLESCIWYFEVREHCKHLTFASLSQSPTVFIEFIGYSLVLFVRTNLYARKDNDSDKLKLYNSICNCVICQDNRPTILLDPWTNALIIQIVIS